jgi:hypothetical protein
MNPEPSIDKTFDTIQYRMDVFKDNNLNNLTYLPNETFETIEFKNEFQQKEMKLNLFERRNPNIKKKFRT